MNCTPAETTGHRQLESFGSDFGGRDDYYDRSGIIQWGGCLDAPSRIAAGSVVPVFIPESIGGMGYEGNVSSLISR